MPATAPVCVGKTWLLEPTAPWYNIPKTINDNSWYINGNSCKNKQPMPIRCNRIFSIPLRVCGKVVILQAEINRGTVRWRPQFGDDLSSEPTCRFLFLCLYCSNAILNLLSCAFHTNHHFYKANAYQFIVHFQHIGKYLLIGDPFLRRFGLSIYHGIS